MTFASWRYQGNEEKEQEIAHLFKKIMKETFLTWCWKKTDKS